MMFARMYAFVVSLTQAVLTVLLTDPRHWLRETDDPYAPWVITIAKIKMVVLPWYWKS